MLLAIIQLAIRLKALFFVLLLALIGIGVYAAQQLPIDAVPDVSTMQVSVLTDAPGLSPIEVERTVTIPMELALNGVPWLVELRSVSRSGLVCGDRDLQGRHRHLARAAGRARARAAG